MGLQEVPQATASNLFECLDFHITHAGLGYKKIIGWNSDLPPNILVNTRVDVFWGEIGKIDVYSSWECRFRENVLLYQPNRN